MNIWTPVLLRRPPENILIETKVDDQDGIRNEQDLIFWKNLWWIEDKSVYVYYCPTHWRLKSEV